MKTLETVKPEEVKSMLQRRLDYWESKNALVDWLIEALKQFGGKDLTARVANKIQKDIPQTIGIFENLRVDFYGEWFGTSRFKASLEISNSATRDEYISLRLANALKAFNYDLTVADLETYRISQDKQDRLKAEFDEVENVTSLYNQAVEHVNAFLIYSGSAPVSAAHLESKLDKATR